jgi:hypothetical protein
MPGMVIGAAAHRATSDAFLRRMSLPAQAEYYEWYRVDLLLLSQS